MANATGFLLRNNLSDTGTLPRSGNWTGCPDIIPAGVTALSRNDLVASYGSLTDKPLTQNLTNYLYVRAKNMNAASLNQVVYLFQVPGTLVLQPQLWYKQSNLVGYDVRKDGGIGTPDNPKIYKQYERTLSAQPGGIAVTDAYNWTPASTEHTCMVAVVADSWQDVLGNYDQAGSMDALAQWVLTNPSMGWHNVSIQPYTGNVYESQIAYAHPTADETVIFTLIANNAPVGAAVSFSANSSTASGDTISTDWTTVVGKTPGSTINPDFEVGTRLVVNAGYKTVITYRTDFKGLPRPANFKMSMKASKETAAPQAEVQALSGAMGVDSLVAGFHRAHSADALFVSADGEEFGTGLRGYRSMVAASPFDDEDDLEDTTIAVIGSATTTPASS
jgi:hypothetical protein